MTYLERAQEFLKTMQEKGSWDAFENYYHDEVEVKEMPTGEVRNGKEAQRNAIKEWFGMVEEMHGEGVNAVTANEEAGTTMIESWFDVTMKGGHRMKMEEVGIQEWKDGKIWKERFYYNSFE